MAKSKSDMTLADHEEALAEACRVLPPTMAAHGPEEHLRRQAVEAFLAALRKKQPQLEVLTLHGPASAREEHLPLAAVWRELESGSLFAPARAVVLRRAEHVLFRGKSAGEPEAAAEEKASRQGLPSAEEKIAAYLARPAPGIWLVIETQNLDRRSRLGKALAATTMLIPCPEVKQHADLLRWLRQRARQMKKDISPEAAEMLIAGHGARLGALNSEVEKLALYVGDRQTIAAEDAAQFLGGSAEFEIFSLSRAVEERALAEAVRYAYRVVKQGVRDQAGRLADGEGSGQMAMALLGRTLQGLLVARLAVAAGESAQELAQRLGMHPYRAQRLYEAAQRFTLRDLRRAIALAAEECRASHDTAGDVKTSLMRLAIACCRQAK